MAIKGYKCKRKTRIGINYGQNEVKHQETIWSSHADRYVNIEGVIRFIQESATVTIGRLEQTEKHDIQSRNY